MLKEVDLVYRTMFAELEQRSLDAAFQSDFSPGGWFVTVPVKGREYFYFEIFRDGHTTRSYVGSKDDPEIARRVVEFQELKNDFKSRRKLVSTLIRQARLNPPERFTGDVVAALSKAGLFRLRGVLVGTVAYQNYAGPLGVRLPATAMQTGDADFAQFHSVSAAVGDSIPSILDVIRAVDPTFREIPHQADGRYNTAFENASRFKVEFLTPNRSSDDHEGHPAIMPALGGASAQPLRFLDFLIHDPVRSVLLHKSGVPITIPAPERYALHKLIVASRRRLDGNGIAKRAKDVMQASSLMEALVVTRRHSDLAAAFAEARGKGRSWSEALKLGFSYLRQGEAERFKKALADGLEAIGESSNPSDLFEAAEDASPSDPH